MYDIPGWRMVRYLPIEEEFSLSDWLLILKPVEPFPEAAEIESAKRAIEERIAGNLSNGWFIAFTTHATDDTLHYFKVAIRRDV
jgi:hypothetical protein